MTATVQPTPEQATRQLRQAVALVQGVEIIGTLEFMRDAKGSLMPKELVKPFDQLMDQVVRKMIFNATELSAQIGRFKDHCYDDVGAFQALIAQEYGATVGGAKGNIQLLSYDGRLKVQFQVANLIVFGPELQAAKTLVDECLSEWGQGSRDEIRAIITRAFNVDQAGKINRADLFMLMRVNIVDEKWHRAMTAIRDSIRVTGTKNYVRFYQRETADGAWQPISIDLATVKD